MTDTQFVALQGDFKVSKEMNFVFLGLLLIVIEYLLVIYCITVKTRIHAFRRRHMRDFDEIHKKEFGKDKSPRFGFPDCGNGYFAQSLSYKDWFNMNNGQRAQGNFLEHLFFYLVVTFITGLWDWRWAFGA